MNGGGFTSEQPPAADRASCRKAATRAPRAARTTVRLSLVKMSSRREHGRRLKLNKFEEYDLNPRTNEQTAVRTLRRAPAADGTGMPTVHRISTGGYNNVESKRKPNCPSAPWKA
ncbi:hypothetical protein CR205_19575 [Alteribacter lacisalsi]|uniref:Uncharacterized protein n=1 Tax=Alteribacter lacisalsi TaxID=2045244 RepID=A0A2W0HF45_9BACI|nr:hypothetical protein CR205_19575 [Alteribacter lacisalsi]